MSSLSYLSHDGFQIFNISSWCPSFKLAISSSGSHPGMSWILIEFYSKPSLDVRELGATCLALGSEINGTIFIKKPSWIRNLGPTMCAICQDLPIVLNVAVSWEPRYMKSPQFDFWSVFDRFWFVPDMAPGLLHQCTASATFCSLWVIMHQARISEFSLLHVTRPARVNRTVIRLPQPQHCHC